MDNRKPTLCTFFSRTRRPITSPHGIRVVYNRHSGVITFTDQHFAKVRVRDIEQSVTIERIQIAPNELLSGIRQLLSVMSGCNVHTEEITDEHFQLFMEAPIEDRLPRRPALAAAKRKAKGPRKAA